MNMKSFFSLLLAGLAVAAPTVTPVNGGLAAVEARDNTIQPRQGATIRFNSISASGSGCPSGSFSTIISSNGDSGTIAFRQYSVVTPSPLVRDCTVSISLTYPSGCTAGNLEGTSHGFAQVNSGVTGRYRTSYTSSTGNSANPPESVFSGSAWQNGAPFTKIDIAPAKVTNRSPNTAGVTATVTTRLSLTSGSGGTLTGDDISFRITNQSNNPNWQTCTV